MEGVPSSLCLPPLGAYSIGLSSPSPLPLPLYCPFPLPTAALASSCTTTRRRPHGAAHSHARRRIVVVAPAHVPHNCTALHLHLTTYHCVCGQPRPAGGRVEERRGEAVGKIHHKHFQTHSWAENWPNGSTVNVDMAPCIDATETAFVNTFHPPKKSWKIESKQSWKFQTVSE